MILKYFLTSVYLNFILLLYDFIHLFNLVIFLFYHFHFEYFQVLFSLNIFILIIQFLFFHLFNVFMHLIIE